MSSLLQRSKLPTDQKAFLRRTKNNMLARFTDSDKDKVINGLDCQWRNKRKHNLEDKLKPTFAEKIRMAKERYDKNVGRDLRESRERQKIIKQKIKFLAKDIKKIKKGKKNKKSFYKPQKVKKIPLVTDIMGLK